MLLTELHLSHVIKGEILTGPSAYKDLFDTLLRESMVRHSFQRLLVRSNLENGPLFSMAMSPGIFMMMVVVAVAVIMIMAFMAFRTMWRMRQEVDDQEHPARLQSCHEPLRRQVRVVKVVKAQPDDREVEARELTVAEGFRVLVLGHAEVAVERDHLIFGKALGDGLSVSGLASFLRGNFSPIARVG